MCNTVQEWSQFYAGFVSLEVQKVVSCIIVSYYIIVSYITAKRLAFLSTRKVCCRVDAKFVTGVLMMIIFSFSAVQRKVMSWREEDASQLHRNIPRDQET